MKVFNSHIFTALAVLIFTSSCQKNLDSGTVSPDAQSIGEYVKGPQYDANDLLNVQNITGVSALKEAGTTSNSTSISGGYIECKTVKYDLKNNFEDIAILRPTNGVIYPGALVIADAATLDGVPTPAGVDRAPVTLRLDLPGIGQQGNLKVDNPTNASVQTQLDNALEWWNANAYQDGYVNASNSSYVASTSYSSRQLSMDVGLNVEWASSDLSSQFNYVSTQTERTAMMVFKQVFYSVTMDAPLNPGDVFGSKVKQADIEAKFSATAPPAYVQAVNYGRIIMFRMTTTESATDAELKGALNYATGVGTKVSGTIETKYRNILNKSTINVITIGGNASVASEATSAQNFGDLHPIITGKNAVYSRDNPGVPISYKLVYLKDNSTAKLGYTTEYNVQNCNTYKYPSANISLQNKNGLFGASVRYTITYKTTSASGAVSSGSISSGTIADGKKVTKTVPAGAYDIVVKVEVLDAVRWIFLQDYKYSRPTQACFQTTQSFITVTIKSVNC